jgi:DNA repair protein SbcC/Rad50
MKIRIKKLSLVNFKGIKLFEVLFFNNSTNIYGDNATGKTTLMDAFLWLLFGKDSSDRKDFQIKTLDHKGSEIPKIEHEVSAVIEVDGTEHTLKRILREKWQTRRGSKEAEFTGNETVYFWNDVPLQQKDYQAKINSMVQEDVFKLLTNVLFFNSLDWQKRRSVLTQIAGTVTDGEIASSNLEYKQLIDLLVRESKTLEEYKKQLSATKKKLKEELEAIPTRIDEARRGMPEQIDFTLIEGLIADKNIELNSIEASMIDASKVQQQNLNAIQQKQSDIHQLKSKQQNIEFDLKQQFQSKKSERLSAINELQRIVTGHRSEIDSLNRTHTALNNQRTQLETERAKLRDQWSAENQKELVFNDDQFCCPTCKRSYEADDVESKKEELKVNFNSSKTEELKRIKDRGDVVSENIQSIESRITETRSTIEKTDSELEVDSLRLNDLLKQASDSDKTDAEQLSNILASNGEIKAIIAEIASLEQHIQSLQSVPADNTELKAQKAQVVADIDELKKQLATKDQIEKATTRINKLQEDESNLAQQVADLEGIEFTIQSFEKAKIDALEAKVNGMFEFVKFKMFETQINGGEVPCCETLVKSNGSWVPFPDANNAGKINAGLDIINRLSQHYSVQCPVFIDNRESVTSLINTDTQLVNLIVSLDDKKLRVV